MRDGIIEDTPVAQCVTGCRVRGQHLATCADPCVEECERRCTDHCRGCRPKRAHGNLAVCRYCRDQVTLAINAIPNLVSWIATQDGPSSGAVASNGDKIKRTKKSPPLPFRADSIDSADALHSLLVAWVRMVVEYRPGGMAGPDLRGSVQARKVLADRWGPVVGLGVNNPPRTATGRTSRDGRPDRLNDKGQWSEDDWIIAPSPTRNAATWLTTHLEWALEQPFAGDMVNELTTAVRQARRRWPVEPRPEIAEAECFDCGGQLARIAGDEGFPEDWTCNGCGETYSKERYAQALLYVRHRERAAMEDRIQAGKSDAADDLAYVSVEDAATWTGRKMWTIRTWMQQDVVRKRKVGAKVQVNLYDVTREHNSRAERQRGACVPDA